MVVSTISERRFDGCYDADKVTILTIPALFCFDSLRELLLQITTQRMFMHQASPYSVLFEHVVAPGLLDLESYRHEFITC